MELSHISPDAYALLILRNSRSPTLPSVQGIFVFLAGNVLQCWSHMVLARLGRNAARPIRSERKGADVFPIRAEEREPTNSCHIRARNGSPGGDISEEGIAGRVRRRHHQTAAAVAGSTVGSGNSTEAAAEEVAGSVAGEPEAKLRADGGGRGKGDDESGTVYRIPRGGMFELISCPHYLGEVVVYCGIILLTGGRLLNTWLMLAWVVSGCGMIQVVPLIGCYCLFLSAGPYPL